MNKFNVAILATGGMDSTLLMYQAVAEGHKPTIITIDYGQVATNEEQRCLNLHIDRLGLQPLIVLPFTFASGAKPGLFTEGFVPSDKTTGEDRADHGGRTKFAETHIEARNAFLCLTALAYCAEHKIDELRTGFISEQYMWDNMNSLYHFWTNDSTPTFIDAINVLAVTGMSHYVRLSAPFINNRWNKQDVFDAIIAFNVDVAKETYSCCFYPQCNDCASCKTRQRFVPM